MLLAVIFFFVGLILLYYGAEALVNGSSRLALSYGMRPIIIGMTIVALATSMPELMVSLFAANGGSADIAIGNIVGSNVANIGLVLGMTALVAPIRVSEGTLKREIPIMLGMTVLLYLFSLNGTLGFWEGVILLSCLMLFIFRCLKEAIQKPLDEEVSEITEEEIRLTEEELEDTPPASVSRGRNLFFVLIGIIGLGGGAHIMVKSAVYIARDIGISEMVIGMSVVALGTSLPELAASTISAWRGEADIGVGNVIGSNIFNIGLVLGVCAMIKPLTINPSVLTFEYPAMLGFSVLLLPLLYRKLRLGRGKGLFMLACYAAFVGIMFL